MSDQQDISSLKKYSAANIGRLRAAAGSFALEILPGLMERHAEIFRMGFFHETSPKNIPGIKKSKAVYSFDELKRRGKKNTAGMTIAQNSTSDIFNNVSHAADSFTDYVYGRPVFGGVKKRSFGILWPDTRINDEMWFSFEDPNQLTLADKELIEWGMNVVKGFNSYDVYVGQDFPEAIALAALRNVAQIEYLGRLKKYGYDRQAAFHASDPVYTKPDEKMNMDFAKAFEYYEGIALQPDSACRAYDNACCGYNAEERRAELKSAGLALDGGQPPVVTQSMAEQKEFEKYFADSCRSFFSEIAAGGQASVPKSLGTTGAIMPKIARAGKVFGKKA